MATPTSSRLQSRLSAAPTPNHDPQVVQGKQHPTTTPNMMGASSLSQTRVVPSTSWAYAHSVAPPAAHAPPPIFGAAPPTAPLPPPSQVRHSPESSSNSSTPRTIPPGALHVHPSAQVPGQVHHTIYHPAAGAHPHLSVPSHDMPTHLSPHAVPTEYIHTNVSALPPIGTAAMATTVHIPANTAPTASTSYYQQRVRQLEEELLLARREIERLSTRLADFEKEHAAKASTTNGTPAKTQSRYWTQDEHMRFLEALGKFGPKDVRSIATYVGSRSATQVRTHAQKYFLRVQRQAAQRGGGVGTARRRSMSESDLTKMGSRAKTPPGSPRVDDVKRELGPAAAGIGTYGVMGGRVAKRDRTNATVRKVGSPTSSAAKPPVIGGSSSAAINPTVKTDPGIPKTCGINLLSIVASERKEAMNQAEQSRQQAAPPAPPAPPALSAPPAPPTMSDTMRQQDNGHGANKSNDTEMRDAT